jgi:dihydrodipicolinate synthase/N-acetylneuraminate lyase
MDTGIESSNPPGGGKHEIWSASPTPLLDDYRLDRKSLQRLIRHLVKNSVDGVFLAGNAGEGPYLLDEDRRELTRIAVIESGGRIKVSVQVSDNSALRILEKIDHAAQDGVDMVVLAEPFYLRNPTKENFLGLYREVLNRSPLPVGIYNLGEKASIPIPLEILKLLYLEENVVMIKDSSSDPVRRSMALEIKRQRPDLKLFNGDEFKCCEYAEAGYDGVLFGGACFNLARVRAVLQAVNEKNRELARKMDDRLRELNWTVYGRDVQFSLAGLKYLLVRLGLFTSWINFSNYPLPEHHRNLIDDLVSKGPMFESP